MKWWTKNWLALGLSGIIAAGCGIDLNFNQLWGSDEDRVDAILAEGKAAYDRGDFAEAERLGKKAYAINSDNEEAVILLGYVFLSKGGIEPFSLARKLAPEPQTPSTPGSGSSGSGTTDLLEKVEDIINVSSADRALLGALYKEGSGILFNTTDGTELTVPTDVTSDLRSQVPTLAAMSEAMRYICPFVDQDAGEALFNPAVDSRHDCGRTAQTRKYRAKTHFLWAFSHLTEALVYQTILLASLPADASGASKTPIQAGAENFAKKTDVTLETIVEAINEINDAVDSMFNLEDPNSQLSVTIRNLEVVEASFATLRGLPDSFSGSITKNLDRVREAAKTVRQKAVEQVSSKITTEYDKVLAAVGGNAANIPAEQRAKIAEICAAYDDLALGVDDSKKPTPSGC